MWAPGGFGLPLGGEVCVMWICSSVEPEPELQACHQLLYRKCLGMLAMLPFQQCFQAFRIAHMHLLLASNMSQTYVCPWRTCTPHLCTTLRTLFATTCMQPCCRALTVSVCSG